MVTEGVERSLPVLVISRAIAYLSVSVTTEVVADVIDGMIREVEVGT